MATTNYGLGVGGFIALVKFILILNVAGVIGYNVYTKKNPDKAIAVDPDSDIVPGLRYGMLGLLFLSWIFSIACTIACTFLKISYSYSSFQEETEKYYYLGLRGVEQYNNGVCYRSGDIEDNRVRTAYAFGVINNLLTTAALVGCVLVAFKVIKDDTMAKNMVWKTMGLLILASTWCCLFTFYVQESERCASVKFIADSKCSLGEAGVAQVFNCIFLIGICVLFFVLPSPAALPSPATEEENGNDADKDVSNTEEDDEATNSKENMHEDIELADVKQEEGIFLNLS